MPQTYQSHSKIHFKCEEPIILQLIQCIYFILSLQADFYLQPFSHLLNNEHAMSGVSQKLIIHLTENQVASQKGL